MGLCWVGWWHEGLAGAVRLSKDSGVLFCIFQTSFNKFLMVFVINSFFPSSIRKHMALQEEKQAQPFTDIFDEDEAEISFLLSKPSCFIVFGKPVRCLI